MKRTLIKNTTIINEGKQYNGSLIIEDGIIADIIVQKSIPNLNYDEVVDGSNQFLLPGIIDDHVHFRDPGLTQKGDIFSESQAAVAGGVTSIMDMPNTSPQTTSIDALNQKLEIMSEKCLTNYSCYFGATNQNIELLPQLDKHSICGVKVFMGASTGNMLVDRLKSLEAIFSSTDLLIATHCENQDLIRKATNKYKSDYNTDDLPLKYHSIIRSDEACFQSSSLAVKLAKQSGARLHILHLTTAKELSLLDKDTALEKKQITAEACVGHLTFCDNDYENLGTRIKCNPSIKTIEDRKALQEAVMNDTIDVIATDHAPHLLIDKKGGALKAASGMPSIQFSLISMLELVDKGIFTLEAIVQKMCHAPAIIYKINNRGFIRKGYQADLTLISKTQPWTISQKEIKSSCGWSPFEGKNYNWKVNKTWVNGNLVYHNNNIELTYRGQQLKFL